MSTSGFVIFVADNEAKTSYNHWDSGPRDLGIKMLRWLRAERDQPDRLRAAITSLKVVSDDDGPLPTAEEVSRLHQYSDPGACDPAEEWYALLRGTQGRPAAILASGYVICDDDGGWTYEVNADEQNFSVHRYDDNRLTWPWSALPTDQRFLDEALQLGPNNE